MQILQAIIKPKFNCQGIFVVSASEPQLPNEISKGPEISKGILFSMEVIALPRSVRSEALIFPDSL